MNKNTIEGRRDWTSWHNTAKSIGSVVEVNRAVAREATRSYLGRPCVSSVRESAEAVGMSREPGTGDGRYKQRNRKTREP